MYDKMTAMQLGQQLKKLYDKKLVSVQETYRLTKVELDVLIFLYHHPDMNCARDIAKKRMIAKSAVSKAIDELISRGYLISRADEQDRRTFRLSVTKDASDVIAMTEEVQNHLCQSIYQGITLEEQSMINQVIEKIQRNINNQA